MTSTTPMVKKCNNLDDLQTIYIVTTTIKHTVYKWQPAVLARHSTTRTDTPPMAASSAGTPFNHYD